MTLVKSTHWSSKRLIALMQHLFLAIYSNCSTVTPKDSANTQLPQARTLPIIYSKKLNDDGKRHLSKLTKQNVENLPLGTALRIAIPANMSLLATMNSADQGVYPLDTAFKRRWDFMYVSIDDEQQQTDRKWDEQRQKINHLLLNKAHVNEDKLIGPFFIKQSIPWASKEFSETFKYKVIMYLFEDAARYKRKEIFADYTSGRNTLGKLFEDWDDKNFAIFSDMDSVADFPRK